MNPFQLYPEFDVPDWTRLKLNEIPAERINGFIDACLTDKEFQQIMMHQYGSLVLGASKNLLKRTNYELMEPLGQLTDKMDTDDDTATSPDWRQLKRNQRDRALREYWERIRKRRDRMRELAKLFPRSSPTLSLQSHNATVLSSFLEPFSPKADMKRHFFDDLAEINKIGLSRQLPWRQIISQEIFDGKPTLSDLSPIIPDHKKDTALKLQFLLEKAQHQEIAIQQDESFGQIRIEPIGDGFDPNLTVRDAQGNENLLDWSQLNPAQRDKVIINLLDSKVVLV